MRQTAQRAEFGVQQPNGCGLIGLIDRVWTKIESKNTPGAREQRLGCKVDALPCPAKHRAL